MGNLSCTATKDTYVCSYCMSLYKCLIFFYYFEICILYNDSNKLKYIWKPFKWCRFISGNLTHKCLLVFFSPCAFLLLVFISCLCNPWPATQLLLHWIMWMDSVSRVLWPTSAALWANLWHPLWWKRHTQCPQKCSGAKKKKRTISRENDGFGFGLRGLSAHVEQGEDSVGCCRVFLTALCFKSTRTCHMPQIIWSHQAADFCSNVSGDGALLSTAVGVTAHVWECQDDVDSICVCVGLLAVCVRA